MARKNDRSLKRLWELTECVKVGSTIAIIGAVLMIVWIIAGLAHTSGGQEYRDVAINVYFVILVLGIVIALPAWIKTSKKT